MSKTVAVVMGSDSDLPIVQKTFDELDKLGIPYTATIISAHRTPQAAANFALAARQTGVGVIIAAAGMAAHLAGVLAAYTTLPVIGIPCTGGAPGGLDALLSTLQMPPGVPVATVAINGGANAALLAAQILGVTDEALAAKLEARKNEMADSVAQKNADLQQKLFGTT